MTTRFPDAGPLLAAVAVIAGALAGERVGGAGPGRGTALAAVVALAGAVLLARKKRPPAGRLAGGVPADWTEQPWAAGLTGGTPADRAEQVGAAALAGSARIARAQRPRAAAIAGLVGLGLLAATSMQRALDGLGGRAAVLATGREPVVVAARLADDPRAGWGRLRVPVRLEALRDGGHAARSRARVLVVARGPTAMRLRLLGAGEGVVLSGRLRPLEGGPEDIWRWRHVAGVLEADDLLAARPVTAPVLRAANDLRALVLRGSEPLPPATRALVAGFLVGDDRNLPPKVAADFRAAGLSHLLVVSGANVALALTLAGPGLRRLGLAGRLAGGVAVLSLFAAMTRFEPSVLRASAMAGLSLLAAFVGRPASGLRLLALAAAALVLADPFLIHSVGFQLSCGASAGIVLLARPLAARLPGPEFARQSLAVTAAAQVGVAPVVLPVFGGLPLVALPANLAAAPAAAALTVWGLGSGLAGGVVAGWWAGAAAFLQVPTAALAGYLTSLASAAARMPVVVTPGQTRAAALLATVACALRWRRRNRSLPSTSGPRPAPTAAHGRARSGLGR